MFISNRMRSLAKKTYDILLSKSEVLNKLRGVLFERKTTTPFTIGAVVQAQ